MEWLKKILESAKINDGKLEVDGILEAVKTEFPKYAVPKDKYNTLSTAKTELETQFAAANEQIQAFKGMDIDSIKTAAEEWKTKAEAAEKDAQAKIQSLQFDYALDGALSGAKAKNAKAVKALLDMEGLKFNNGEIVGLSEQLEKIKTDNDYLFDTNDGTPAIVRGTPGTGTADGDMLRSVMGLSPAKN